MQRTRSSTIRFPRPIVMMLVMAATLLASCTSGGTAGPNTIAPLATSAPTSTDAPSSTEATTPPTMLDDPPIQLSADGPWQRVASAPGVDKPGLYYLLMDGVWVYLPVEFNLDEGITWTLNEIDRPVIEAYLMARLTYYKAVTANPMTFDDPGWDEYYLNAGGRLISMFEQHAELDRHVDLADGVVLRPVVAGDLRTDSSALILDCTLDGAVLLESSGQTAPGSRRGIFEGGLQASLALVAGSWKVDRVSDGIDSVCD